MTWFTWGHSRAGNKGLVGMTNAEQTSVLITGGNKGPPSPLRGLLG
jgi:hypothetical protein